MMGRLFEKLRVAKRKFYIWKYGLKYVHSTFIAAPGCHISPDFEADEYSYVGPGCAIAPKVKIGRYTMVANDVKILGGDHYYKRVGAPIIFSGRAELRPTILGHDVWVGAYSLIMTGVTIGNGAIVAAGSVVTKDVPPYAIVGGCPAKVIKMRFEPDQIEVHERIINQPSSVLPPPYEECAFWPIMDIRKPLPVAASLMNAAW